MVDCPYRSVWAVIIFVVGLLAAGCTQTKSFVRETVPAGPQGGTRVLLLEPDIELSELSASGLLTPKAEWTERARDNVDAALVDVMAERQATLVHYQEMEDASPESTYSQLLKLHEAVGQTILIHKYIAAYALPTKKDSFDWTLGPDVQRLAEVHEADYALFIYFRDSFATAGRVALAVVGAVFGAGIPTGQQVGFASLVDLRTGDVLWFNRLASEVGDLRDPGSAREATRNLLDKFPI